ncbi:MAG: hypothetical protein HY228_00185 [Candidatus Yonathbacteria bacterium]|nr:hypothetical protein [Candidatus Yonathbacteria bacterium]
MKILSIKFSIFAIVATLATTAYAKSIFDIEYPIAELGGCADKTSCKAYCNVSENQEVCENFAASYGVGNAKEKQQERATRKELTVKDGGPGNCAANADDPEKSCRAYCDISGHMNECVAYGKSHGLLKGRELEEAEKVVNALASGVALPEGCTSGESCKQMCEEPKNVGIARACFAFAEKAGLLPPNVDRAQAEKIFKLIEEGKAPFKSPKDFKQCENPESDEIMEKCLKFGEDNGLIPQKDLEMIKKTGGKGPGGCRGKEQCDTYCSEHQDECMKFAEEHNLVAPEDKARMEEGLARFKEGIANAPAEVKQCLEGIVGRDNLEQMIAGRQTPKRDFGDKMRGCFENVFGAPSERGAQEGGFQNMMRPEGQGFRPPFMQQEGSTSSFRGDVPFMQGRGEQGKMMLPPQVEECVKGKVGEMALREIGTAQTRGDSATSQAISSCMREFEGQRGEGFSREEFPQSGTRGQMMPPQFDRGQGQGTTSQLFQPREGQQFDPRKLIDPQYQDRSMMDSRMQGMPYGNIPEEGQMYPPQGGIMPYYQGGAMPLPSPPPPSSTRRDGNFLKLKTFQTKN